MASKVEVSFRIVCSTSVNVGTGPVDFAVSDCSVQLAADEVDSAQLTAIVRRSLNEKAATGLRAWADGEAPEGYETPWHGDASDLRRWSLPKYLSTPMDRAEQELDTAARRVYRMLLWKHGMAETKRRELKPGALMFSFDGTSWHPSDLGSIFATIEAVDDFRRMDEVEGDIRALLDDGRCAPVWFELLSEAWDLHVTAPRSSLIIAGSALEVGLKELADQVAPSAGLVLRNVNSPSSVKLLQSVVAQLPAKNTVYGEVLTPPEKNLELIQKAVSLRSAVVHAGKEASSATIEKYLAAIEKTLYLLDFYAGNKAAWHHVGGEESSDLIGRARSED